MAMASEKNNPLSHGPLRKGVGGIAVPEPSSWAEIMHRQTSSNRNRPRPDAEYAMPFRETRYAKSRDEVVYNPVLQTFTDHSRETVSKQREETRRISNLNQARDRQIARESQFDVLNMSDKRSGLGRSDAEVAAAAAAAQAAHAAQPTPKHSAKPTFRHPLDSCYQFNIVSNLPLSQHHYTAPELRPNMDNREDPKPRLQTTTNLPRDFDVLSNRYREGHDAKVALETEVQRRTAAKKYWETHDYDPFTCTYLDDDKEAAFQASIAQRIVQCMAWCICMLDHVVHHMVHPMADTHQPQLGQGGQGGQGSGLPAQLMRSYHVNPLCTYPKGAQGCGYSKAA